MFTLFKESIQWIDCTASGWKHWNWHLKDLFGKSVNILYSSGRGTEKIFLYPQEDDEYECGISSCSITIKFPLGCNTKRKWPSTFKANYFLHFTLWFVELWGKRQVRWWKTRGGLWCKRIWINTSLKCFERSSPSNLLLYPLSQGWNKVNIQQKPFWGGSCCKGGTI